jgi:formylglycine-generating enzyme required for sulfatase activity
MAGNVWEWTRSLYLDYPYDPADPKREDLMAGDDVSRVVRGGSWDSFIEASPAAPPATGFSLALGLPLSVFGWCCVLPLFFDSVLCSL